MSHACTVEDLVNLVREERGSATEASDETLIDVCKTLGVMTKPENVVERWRKAHLMKLHQKCKITLSLPFILHANCSWCNVSVFSSL